ncbi:sensor histidine kinase [Aquirufa sp. ROCK-SH2]
MKLFLKNSILFFVFSLISRPFFGQTVEQILKAEQDLKKPMPEIVRLKYLYNLADLYNVVDSAKASKYLMEGFLLSKKNAHFSGMGYYYDIVSVEQLMYRNYSLAQSESLKSAYYYLKGKDTSGCLNAKYTYLRAKFESGQKNNFDTYAKQALKLAGNKFSVEKGKIYTIFATFYRNSNYNLSKIYFKSALKNFYLSKDFKWMVNPSLNLSRIYHVIGKKDSAIYFSKQAVKYAKYSNSIFGIDYLIAETRLSTLMENKSPKDAIQGIENLTRYSIMFNSKLIRDQGKNTQVLLLKIRESQQKFNNTLLVIGLGLIFILSVFFLIIYFQSKKRQEELTYINQELEFSSYQNQILLKETNHRVKNNFQMILSLLNLHANSPESNNKNFMQLSIARITAMAKVHEILYRKEVGQIEVLPYFHEILKLTLDSCFDKSYSLKINVEPKDQQFNIHTILPLGLMVNEMVINAIKHAFKDLDKGLIEISLTKLNNEYQLTFQDNGIGIDVETIDELSSGVKMIKSLALQLKGNAEIFCDNGTKYIIHFSQIGK